MKHKILIKIFISLLLVSALGSAWAVTITSSTMEFQGTLTANGSGKYTGSIMLSQAFDNYAMIGSIVQSSASSINGGLVGIDHDAYPNWNPDVPDVTWYALNLDGANDTWDFRYLNTENDPNSGAAYTPLSGSVYWTDNYVSETDQNWSENWISTPEDIKYAFPGFTLDITDNGSGNYTVKLIPAAAPTVTGVVPIGPVVNTNTGESYGTIQTAIDAATDGDIIQISEGTFSEALSIGKSLTFIGSGPTSNPTTIITSATNRVIQLTVTGKSFTFQNLIVEGIDTNNGFYAGSTIDINSLTMQDVIARNCQVGLYLSEKYPNTTTVSNLSMDNVTLTNNKFIGAYIGKTVLSGTVTNCTVTDNGYSDELPDSWQKTGLQFVNFDDASVPHVVVTNSNFSNNGAGASNIERTGLIIYTAYNGFSASEIMTVSGCSFSNHLQYAVRIKNGYNEGNTATVNGTFTDNYLDIWFNNIVGSTTSTTLVRNTFIGIRTVGEGPTYDYSTIQSAIDAANDGDVIEVSPGTYTENVVINVPNITLQSTGGREVTIVDNPNIGAETIGISVLANMGTVTVDGFTADGFRNGICQSMSQSAGTSYIVKNCKVIPENNDTNPYLRNGIQVTGDNSQVIDNYVVGAPLTSTWASAGIGVINASNVLVQGNTVNTASADIGINVYNYSNVTVENITINNNIINGADKGIRLCGQSGNLYAVSGIEITNNVFSNGTRSGIQFYHVTLSDITIQGNDMHDNAYFGIEATNTALSGPDILVKNNDIKGHWAGIYFYSGCTISGDINVTENAIYENSNYHFANAATGQAVNATHNYWGPNGPLGLISDNVNYSPWWGDAAGTYSVWYTADDTELAAGLAAAEPGDVIEIAGGTYAPITIAKGVTISGETDIRDATVFDGGGSGTVVTITSDDAVFENCTVQNSGPNADDAGIKIVNPTPGIINGVTVQNNIVTDNANGIVCIYGTTNLIKGNAAINNDFYGIALIAGSANTLETNNISGNGLDAIALENGGIAGGPVTDGSTGNFLKGNIVSSARDGIYIGQYCDANSITDNNVINNVAGIGIHLWRGGTQTITDNSISNSLVGMKLRGVTNGTVSGNSITSNATGIELEVYFFEGVWYPCTNNDISDNKIYGNTLGVKGDDVQQTEVNVENNWWGDPAGPTPPRGRAGNGVTTNVDYDPWWIDEGMTTLSENVVVYVDAPESLIKDEELQTYSVKVAEIYALRTFEVELRYLKADFDAAANLTIGTAFTTAGIISTIEIVDNSDVTYWNYVVTGGFLGAPVAPANVSGTDVVLFTVDITSLLDASNLTGSTIEIVDVLFYDNNNPYAMIPYGSLTDKDIIIDSGEPTMTHDNVAIYPTGYILQTGVLPALNFTFNDNYNLDDVQYLVQAEAIAAPTLPGDFTGNYIVEDFVGTEESVVGWFFTQGELDALADGTYTIYYLVLDDAGNYSIYDWDFIKDTNPPDAITWVSCLTTPNANNSIDLVWENPADAAKNHIWALSYAARPDASGYPEYSSATGDVPVAPDPAAASPQNGWTFIEVINVATEYTWTGMERGYYYFYVFAEDASGNIGDASSSYVESISYWPGDVNAITPDGLVDANDIALLSAVWGLNSTALDWNDIIDVGPTVDNGRRTLPTPDGVINIEDLMIFAMNYNNTNYDSYPREDDEDITPIHIDMICYHQGALMSIDIVLSGNENLLKGVNIPLYYGNGYQLESLETGGIWPEGTIMLHTNSNGVVELSITTLGSEAVVEGDGVIATLVFETSGNSVPELLHMTARTPNNQEIEIIDNPVTGETADTIIPVTSTLANNYPNPFNPTTTIKYGLKADGEVSIVMYNIKGQKVKTLVNESQGAGYHTIVWDGKDDFGNQVTSGVYFYRMVTDRFSETKKALLLK